MAIHDELKALGLTKTEVLVYLYLLENGLSTPPVIAKGTGILRTNCYHVLQTLQGEGLIKEQEGKGRRVAYLASDPEALYRSIESQRETISRLLPDLRGLYTTQKHKPKIRFYDGLEQVKEVYRSSLESEEIFGIGSTKDLDAVMPDFFQKYVEGIKKKNIIFHDLLTSASREKTGPWMQEVMKGLYDVRYFPKDVGEFPTDILFWDEHIALITLREPYFATIVTSSLLAQTMKTLFRFMQSRL
jgi:HTH-type transcriptional regulator, sugar sensing transcriptional regulator